MIIDKIKSENIIIDRDIAKIKIGDNYNIDDYNLFMWLRSSLPSYDFEYIDEKPYIVTDKINLNLVDSHNNFSELSNHLFDYQKFFTNICLNKKKFALFLDTGLGKTSIEIEIASQLAKNNIKSLIVCPLMVLSQFEREIDKFYQNLKIHNIRNSSLEDFKNSNDKIGLINFEFFKKEKDLLGISGFILDESSILKSENGVYGRNIISSCNKAGIEFRCAASATPAPNDYAELANHALFLGKIKTYSQFFGDWFQKDFKDQTKWILRPHAKSKFYAYLNSWSVIMRHPDKFGFNDNTKLPPEYYLHIDDIGLTYDQNTNVKTFIFDNKHKNQDSKKWQQDFFEDEDINIDKIPKGITIRNKLAQISRGFFYKTINKKKTVTDIYSYKPQYVYRKCYNEFPNEQFLIWVELDYEENKLAEIFQGHNDYKIINGKTKLDDKSTIINDFINGGIRILITKPKIAGFGLNLQHVNKMIYYGISDSYEKFYQSLRRCYRRGQEKHLDVWVPITDLEKPIMDNVNLKSDSWENLIIEQEKYFINNIDNNNNE